MSTESSITIPVLGLRPPEAARSIGISPRKLWEITNAGKGPPHIKIGNATVYPVDGLREWLARESQKSLRN